MKVTSLTIKLLLQRIGILLLVMSGPVLATAQRRLITFSDLLRNGPRSLTPVPSDPGDPPPNPDGVPAVPIGDYWHLILFASGLVVCFMVMKRRQESEGKRYS